MEEEMEKGIERSRIIMRLRRREKRRRGEAE